MKTNTHQQKKGMRNNNNRNYKNDRQVKVIDSNGPVGRLKGTVRQLADKYKSLAYETVNNILLKEELLQYADYYKRLANGTENGVYKMNKNQQKEGDSILNDDENNPDNKESTTEIKDNSNLENDNVDNKTPTRKRVVKTIKIESGTRGNRKDKDLEEPRPLRKGRSSIITSESNDKESMDQDSTDLDSANLKSNPTEHKLRLKRQVNIDHAEAKEDEAIFNEMLKKQAKILKKDQQQEAKDKEDEENIILAEEKKKPVVKKTKDKPKAKARPKIVKKDKDGSVKTPKPRGRPRKTPKVED